MPIEADGVVLWDSYEEYLEHHGILGQRWGKRNGPPYPLNQESHSLGEERAGWRRSLDRGGVETSNKKSSHPDESSSRRTHSNNEDNSNRAPVKREKSKTQKDIDEYVSHFKKEYDEASKTAFIAQINPHIVNGKRGGGLDDNNETAKKLAKAAIVGIGVAGIGAGAIYGLKSAKGKELVAKAILKQKERLASKPMRDAAKKEAMEAFKKELKETPGRVAESAKKSKNNITGKANEFAGNVDKKLRESAYKRTAEKEAKKKAQQEFAEKKAAEKATKNATKSKAAEYTAGHESIKKETKEVLKGDYGKYVDSWAAKRCVIDDVKAVKAYNDEFVKNLSSEQIHIAKGTKFSRISMANENEIRDFTYVSYKEQDIARYGAFLPNMYSANMRLGADAKFYQVTMNAAADLKSPSPKELHEIYEELISNPKFKQSLDAAGASNFVQFNSKFGVLKKTEIGKEYISMIQSRGYNCMIDLNDANVLSEAPMIIFDNKTLTGLSTRELGANDLLDFAKKIERQSYDDFEADMSIKMQAGIGSVSAKDLSKIYKDTLSNMTTNKSVLSSVMAIKESGIDINDEEFVREAARNLGITPTKFKLIYNAH